MCTNKRYITIANGKKIAVSCGWCPACLQEKALARTIRIRNNCPDDASLMCLFVTLTYRNEAIPYFDYDELQTNPIRKLDVNDGDGKSEYEYYKYVNVYRDIVCRRDYSKGYIYRRKTLDCVAVPYPYGIQQNLKPLKNDKSKKYRVGVLHYADFQNFIKRLRQNLKRKYKFFGRIQYFLCSEYGPSTCRPHAHLLIWVPSQDFNLWKTAISEAWPFDDGFRTKKNITIAIDASSYVSSYVNSNTSLPLLFRCVSEWSPTHSYSQKFGVAKDVLSLPSVFEKFRLRDLHFNVQYFRKGAQVDARFILPKYVINRYFPKFKGYCYLNDSEVLAICRRPETIRFFSQRCHLTDDDCHRIEVMLKNKLCYANAFGISSEDYADAYAHIHAVRSSNVLHDFYDGIHVITDYFTAYDNIRDLYACRVNSDLDKFYDSLPNSFPYLVDFNLFPDNIARDLKMRNAFYLYDKSKKTRNSIYSLQNSHF